MSAWVVRLVGWLLRRWRPAEGWLLWLTAYGVAVWPGLALAATEWVGSRAGALIATPALAFPVAWWLASRLPAWGYVLAALGLLYPVILTTVAHVWPALNLWLNGLAHTVAWVVSGGDVGSPGDAWAAWWSAFSWQWLNFYREGALWVQAVQQGTVVSGRLALTVILGVLLYAATWWVAWFGRRRDGLLGAAASVLICGWNAYLAGRSLWWLTGSIGLAAFLAVIAHYQQLEARWRRRRVDYSDQLALDFFLVATLFALGVFLIAPVPSALASPELHARVRRWLSGPWQQVEQTTTRLFPDVRRPGPTGAGERGQPGLPRSHKLGGSPQLLNTEVMVVRPMGGTWPDQVYWFGQAYDVYTGRGWVASPWVPRELAAGEPWQTPDPDTYRLVSHEVRLTQPDDNVYAAGLPVAVNRPARALVRPPADLVGMELHERARAYTVLAAVPVWDEARLRRAGTTYPEEIRSRYLQLPDNLPPRLRELAQTITRGATSPYEKARAIEAYLRAIPYSLQVPLPPKDRDVVDWFLFDLRRGYCDYYASAFVVLARLNGLPARFVIGYAQGSWDPATAAYRVRERDAHSWPEVYFPEVGWVPFEPTVVRTVFRWVPLTVAETPREEMRPTLDQFRAWAGRAWWLALLTHWARRLAVIGLLVAVTGMTITFAWWMRLPPPARPYAGVRRLGRLAGAPDHPALTPAEYEQRVAQHLASRYRRLYRWAAPRVRRAVDVYVRWRYGRK